MKEKISSKEWQLLSAYLDGQLTVREQSQVEQRLRTHPDLNTALQEMRQNRMLLQNLPRRRAPRNFTLTPEMVGQTRRAPLFPNLVPVLRFSSAIAAILLVVTLVLDMTPGLVQQPAATRFEQTPMDVAMESSEAPAAPEAGMLAAEGEADPNVIYWGGPPSVPAYGMGGGGGLGGGGGEGVYTGESLPNVFHEPVPLQSTELKGMGGEEVTPPSEEEAAEPEVTAADVPPIEGAGPILGVPPADQRGMVVATVPPDSDAAAMTAAREGAPAAVNSLRIVQVALAALALLALIGAAWMTHRTRS